MEKKKNSLKIYLIDGACYAYYFSKITLYLQKKAREENKTMFLAKQKFTVSFLGKTMLKVQEHSKILAGLVILELFLLNGW